MEEEKIKIQAAVILEMLGRPAEHLTETLNNLVKEIGSEKGIKVVESKVYDPKEMENQKDMFTTFADLIIEVDNLEWIIVLMFKYMPAHIEIISPENVNLKNNAWNEFLNELASRLHRYDEVARALQAEKMILENKLRELMGKENEDETIN